MPAIDSRPRVKYILHDGRPIPVIHDHDEVPKPSIIFEVTDRDPLWNLANRIPGSARRTVHATLATGL